jgi:hypothetical protein
MLRAGFWAADPNWQNAIAVAEQLIHTDLAL